MCCWLWVDPLAKVNDQDDRHQSLSNGGTLNRQRTKLNHLEDKAMKSAIVFGFVATFVTAGAVSWSTPDGNLVVTLLPALAVGLIVFGVARWQFRRVHPD